MKKTDSYKSVFLVVIYCLILICNSLNCCSVGSIGEPIKLSTPLTLGGKACTYLKFGSSFKSIKILSIPGAIPA